MQLTYRGATLPVVALVWAGVAIGGSLIAAPSKFQAVSLSLAQLLEVGRAQFFWLGVAESLLCTALIGLLALRPANARLRMGAPILVFGVQWCVFRTMWITDFGRSGSGISAEVDH